ncbi:wings apart-like protein regulation of heterochromatin-domain-containing protein [Calycina marina]|uniref:Wings apart-like protein regulation of heterochromatin-domain-containing protein n=1 Tax=Calycina marina TaxID=1763456 RepID=A0A9P8CIF1_9HELO|nr:wings apart-like protein regulation of heterochromatin-domain-containing protein [Calycina marina]
MVAKEEVVMAIPKKRIATYGKPIRKRIPEQTFTRRRLSQSPVKKQTTPVGSSPPSVALSDRSNVETTKKRPSPASVAPDKADVFDVPSSDEETTPRASSARKLITKVTAQNKVQKPINTKVNSNGEGGSRKRVELSPLVVEAKKVATAPIPATLRAARDAQSMELGETKSMVSRPNTKAPVTRRRERLRTPQKISVSPKENVSCTPPPQKSSQSSPDLMDLEVPSQHISPRAQKTWKDVLDSVDGDEAGVQASKSAPMVPRKLLYTTAVPKQSYRSPRDLPRRRLIDTLVEQTVDEDDNMSADDTSTADFDAISTRFLAHTIDNDFLASDKANNGMPVAVPVVAASIQVGEGQIAGPKFTYAKQRSMLAEADFMAQLALDIPTQQVQNPSDRRKSRRGSIPSLAPLPSLSFQEEEEEEGASQTIRSVHELRQAGANNRFMDEIEDFLDRIGMPYAKPSSSRRTALLELAGKFRDKSFGRQFRANGIEQRLFVHLGQETDVVAGFVMISILMALLVDASMPHIIGQLRRQGITRLIIRLVESSTNIVALSKERATNMSKMAQTLTTKHQNNVLQLPIWEDLQPQALSPRTIALKCLETMVRQTREAGNSSEIISKELTTNLFAILETIPDESSWSLPRGGQAIDFCLALSALESHSIAARTVNDEAIWISNYLPIIADSLGVALSRPVHEFGNMQLLLLRLTLNVTNNNTKASNVFARESLMAVTGGVVVAKFKQILRFLTEEDFAVVIDHVVLVLGLMINFADGCISARESFEALQGKDSDPLDAMIQLFVDNVAKTSEAESLEESQRNVAFGYLAVLLGYLSLSLPLAKRIAARQARGSLQPVVVSIEEFIDHHKTADSQFQPDEEGHSANTGLTERLEALVLRLRAMKGAGL